jgi:hypothetical protein
MFKILFTAAISFSFFSEFFAQNVKLEKLEYYFVKLPLNPLPKSVYNYQSMIIAAYEKDNSRKKEQYEADLKAAELQYQKELAEYPLKLKAADEKYAQELAAWEKKPLAEKVVEKQLLNENNKPVKEIPSQPYKKLVEKPVLQTSYDYPALAATYLFLGGFENKPDNFVKIEVTLHGYDYTRPRQLSEQKNSVSVVNGTSTTKQIPYYHIEFTYRHTMTVRVIGADGKEIMLLTPQELNNYSVYKSPETTTSQTFDEEQLVKSFEEKILQDNLIFINKLVNDKFGFLKELRSTNLSYVKSKEDLYTDLLTAYNEGIIGFKVLVEDPESATKKLEHAAQIWQNALIESDLENRKARIDKEVTTMIYFNLLETYFALKESENVDKLLGNLNTISLSNSDRKLKETFELLNVDLKKRIQANR